MTIFCSRGNLNKFWVISWFYTHNDSNINSFAALVKVLGNIKENLSEEDLTEMFSLEDPLTFKKLELYYHSKNHLERSGE